MSEKVHIGIDFGSYFTKSMVVYSRFVDPDIGMTEEAKRLTPSFLAFRAKGNKTYDTNNQRMSADDVNHFMAVIGEKALSHMDLKPNMGTGYFTALAGLEKQYRLNKTKALFANLEGAGVKFNDAIGIFLNIYINSVKRENEIGSVTLSFPASFTLWQRRLFELGLAAVAVPSYSEIEDADAVSLTYMLEKIAKFQGIRKKVLFVDVGATSVKSYVVEFDNSNGSVGATRLSYEIDSDRGGSFVTAALVELVKQKWNIHDLDNAEEHRVLTACERLKTQLTILDKFSAVVENIKGVDRTIELTRSELEKVVVDTGLIDAIKDVSLRASKEPGFDEVEVIGGSSRIPLVQRELKQFLNMSLGHSLNADEAIVTGVAYHMQYALNLSKFKPVQVMDNSSKLDVKLTSVHDNLKICKYGRTCEKRVNLSGLDSTVKIEYVSGAPKGVDSTVQELKLSTQELGNVVLNFAERPLRLLTVEKCNHTCFAGRFKIRENLVDNEIIQLFVSSKTQATRLASLRNEVEQLSLRVLDEISKNSTVRTFTNHTQRIDIIRCAERQKNWVRAPETQICDEPRNFSAHLKELKRCIGPVYRRIMDNTTVWTSIEELYRVIQLSDALIKRWAEREELTDPVDVYRFSEHIKTWGVWINETLLRIHGAPLHLPLPVTTREIQLKYAEVRAEVENMQVKYGGGGVPRVMKGDGTSLDAEQMKEIQKMPIYDDLKRLNQLSKKTDNTDDL